MKIIEVWDLPLRLFHWTLIVLVTVSITTGLMGGIEEMDLHMLSGYGILTLLLFRLLWGFAGNTYARFAQFLTGPVAVLRYVRSLFGGQHEPPVGHNPAAGWMVIAMLAVLFGQAGTGLFATDDIFVEGPLSHLVSSETSGTLTSIHHYNYLLLAGLIGLHLFALAWYYLARKLNLIVPMITGRKAVADHVEDPSDRFGSWRALPLLMIALVTVYGLVNWL